MIFFQKIQQIAGVHYKADSSDVRTLPSKIWHQDWTVGLAPARVERYRPR
jgi:hypothetical protein